MSRGAVVGLLVLAGVVGLSASLGESQKVAIGDTVSSFASAVEQNSSTHHLPPLPQNASAGVLAYYDEDGNWIDDGCSWCAQPSGSYYDTYTPTSEATYYYDGSGDTSQSGDSTFYYSEPTYDPSSAATTYYDTSTPVPTAVENAVSANDDALYWSGDQTVTYTPSNDLVQPTYSGYGAPQNQTYYVYDTSDPYYDNTVYYTPQTYYQTTYQPTWYERMFPGIGQSIVPILPPIMRPTSYSQPVSYAQPVYTPPAPVYTPPAVRPDCSITVSPQTVSYGSSVSVSWVARNATRASLNDVGSVALSGSHTYANQTASRTIGLTVTGAGGTNACYATLVVQQQAAPPTCTISAHPQQIARGQSASLAWTSQNATYAVLSNVGTVGLSSGITVSPSQSTNYFITVYGQGGKTGSCSSTVLVQ